MSKPQSQIARSVAAASRALLDRLEPRVLFSTITVINTNDAGAGSLRDAINQANANTGLDVIDFNIPGSGAHTITPLSALPAITDADTDILGMTQPGYAGAPIIQLSGQFAGNADGLTIDGTANGAGSCQIRGLVINKFHGNGIYVLNATDAEIQNCYIGTNLAGDTALPNFKNGVFIQNTNASVNNRVGQLPNCVGGTVAAGADRNVISGNRGSGLLIVGPPLDATNQSSAGTMIEGNYIGTDATGTKSVANLGSGITIQDGQRNQVGDGSAAGRNLISGNAENGITLTDSSGAGTVSGGNSILGNYIGTDLTGTKALANHLDGILNEAEATYIGGLAPPASPPAGPPPSATVKPAVSSAGGGAGAGKVSLSGNLISANGQYGIEARGENATGGFIINNLIGTAADGTSALGNGAAGILVGSADFPGGTGHHRPGQFQQRRPQHHCLQQRRGRGRRQRFGHPAQSFQPPCLQFRQHR